MENLVDSDEKKIKELLPIRLISTVVKGFGRGSTDLGIPTANVSRDDCSCSFDALPCGIYWGYARVEPSADVYKTAVSIGYNPTYGNTFKTVEPHFIAPPNHPERHASNCNETQFTTNFTGRRIKLSVIGYLRPELPFNGLDSLISAIRKDIVDTESLGENPDNDTLIQKENEWVQSDSLTI